MNDEVERYVTGFGGERTERLQLLRRVVKEVAPSAEEKMSYGLVGYMLNGRPLVYFGAFVHHIGFYATPNGHAAFKEAFSKYKQGKGSVQFPLDQPLPVELVKNVTLYRMQQSK